MRLLEKQNASTSATSRELRMDRIGAQFDASATPAQRFATSAVLGLTLVAIWLLTHRYGGITNDAQLYAIQALARIHPGLAGDLYLRNTSQDQYTVFSPIYAAAIRSLGLPDATLLLWALCRAWLIVAAWVLVRRLAGAVTAWLAVAAAVIAPAGYGGSGVFQFAEDYLSARSLAEALVLTAIACHFKGYRPAAFAIAAAALAVHPLMGLPGLLLLICLELPTRVNLIGAAGGILAACGIAVLATTTSGFGGPFTVIDPAWLEIVRERSQFLFPQLWPIRDWELNARPFVALGLAAAVFDGPQSIQSQLRKLCASASLVAAAGLAVALIAATIGPVAILIQGQAWRWIWIADFLGVLLLAPTVVQMCRKHGCGPLCSVLLLAASDFTGAAGLVYSCAALSIWLCRVRIGDKMTRFWPLCAWTALAAILAWLIAHHWPLATGAASASAAEPTALQVARNLMALRTVGLIVAAAAVYGAARSGSSSASALIGAAMLAACCTLLPFAFPPSRNAGAASESAEFADWVRAIPPEASVLVADGRNSGPFVWFTLGRPNYLTLSQSAGVVFSRETAFEVRRRGEVLSPIMNPSWQVMTNNAQIRAGSKADGPALLRPLTAASLAHVCEDPQLGFVISRENLGFESIPHRTAGPWQDSNLYDCRKLRSRSDADHG
jgi:hypothetical protein